jgi:hypothetical protein
MVHALMSAIGSIRSNPRNNLILFSLPVINLLRRKILERQYKELMRAPGAPSDYLNHGRRIFQTDFLIGIGIQTTVTMIAAIFSSCRPGRLILAIFAFNAAISLPCHFVLAGFDPRRAC